MPRATQLALRRLLPPGAAVGGPIDTTAAVSQDAFRACLEEVAATEGIDAVLAITVPTAIDGLTPAVMTAKVAKPLVAAFLGQQPAVRLIPQAVPVAAITGGPAGPHPGPPDAAGAGRPGAGQPPPARAVPAYAYREAAVQALGHAVRYHAWRERPHGQVPHLTGLRTTDARAMIAAYLRAHPRGGWLPPAAVSGLRGCYQIPLVPTAAAASGPEATRAAAGFAGRSC